MGRKRREKLARRKAADTDASQARRRRPFPRAAVAIAALVAFVAIAATYFAQQSRERASARVAATPAPGIFYKSQGHQGHAGESLAYIERFNYSSNPPTSGAHREIFTQAFINSQPLRKYIQVHVLEHGNVLLQYNCLCPQIVDGLKEIAHAYDDRLVPGGASGAAPADVARSEEAGTAVVVAPYPDMPYKIAMTAWTRLEPLDGVDRTKIFEFVNAYLNDQANAMQ